MNRIYYVLDIILCVLIIVLSVICFNFYNNVKIMTIVIIPLSLLTIYIGVLVYNYQIMNPDLDVVAYLKLLSTDELINLLINGSNIDKNLIAEEIKIRLKL